jgi:SnoaL-like domain
MTQTIESRIAALEARLLHAEDRLAILDLLMQYGPLVDSGSSQEATALWVDTGGYNFSGGFSGGTRLEAPAELIAMYDSEGHKDLVATGVSHFTGTPKITLNGDEAEAVGYSFVILKEGERWFIWRGAINHWTLRRTDAGWRIVERFNRTLDGSEDSHATMLKVLG